MNVPKLRFSEFNDEWKQDTLLNLSAEISYGMNCAAKEYDGINKYIRITDIDEITNKYKIDNIVSPSGDLDNKFIVKENDILFARTGASTGKTYLYNINDGKMYYAGFLIKASIKNHNANFIFQQTKLNRYNKWLKIMSQRSGQPGINSQEYGDYKFYVCSKCEEDKIANFLSLLDKKIELQSKKIEDLKLYKKYISNSFFNNNKNNFKIRDFCKLITASSKINSITENGKYIIMDMGAVSSEGSIISSKQTNSNKDLLFKNDLIMPKDDIGGGQIIGKTAYIPCNDKYVLSDHVYCLKCNNINSLYLHYLINSTIINKKLKRKVTGSAQLGINSFSVLNQDIFVHDSIKQEKIANTLLLLDKKILNNERKITKLNELKKGLMQNMFV